MGMILEVVSRRTGNCQPRAGAPSSGAACRPLLGKVHIIGHPDLELCWNHGAKPGALGPLIPAGSEHFMGVTGLVAYPPIRRTPLSLAPVDLQALPQGHVLHTLGRAVTASLSLSPSMGLPQRV